MLQENDFVVVYPTCTDNTNANCINRYQLHSFDGTILLDRSRGEVLALATSSSMMVGLPILVQDREEEKKMWDDIKVLRFL